MDTMQTLSADQYATSGKKGIPGSTLKIIAIAAMLIDHTAAVILERLLLYRGYGFASISSDALQRWMAQGTNGILLVCYYSMRLIGRFGFPLFCFLLVEGFIHTHSRIKYALRLFLFCLISEIPFDLALTGNWLYPSYQNVFFTLWIGFLAMCAFDYIEKHNLKKWLKGILCLGILLLAMFCADLLKTDYSGMGVLTIAVMYVFRQDRMKSMFAGCVVLTLLNLMEAAAFLMLIPISRYNGKRGLGIKYFFYIFYPAHLTLLFLICKIMGIA